MKLRLFLCFLIFQPLFSHSQTTVIRGHVWDGNTGHALPFVKVVFKDTKIGTYTDSLGSFSIETYFATDSLIFSFDGFINHSNFVEIGKSQEINVSMITALKEINEVVIRPPDELPSTRLHKRVIANKAINNKEKLLSYEYELYNKFQMDINNLGDEFKDQFMVKRLDLVMNYLDSTTSAKTYLPSLLTESISQFYFRNNPKLKKEVVEATRITGIENLQLDQFLGDMYFDINIYDNSINILNRSFISPISNFARNHYRFYLEDSTFIDNQWCYKLRFTPKRSGELTFTGEMWIHDTTYAVRHFSATIAADANINYINSLYFEHDFSQVEKEVWMLTNEKLIVDINLTKKSKTYGFYGRKTSSRKNFIINKERHPSFYKSENTVEFADGSQSRDSIYWSNRRHNPLSSQEKSVTSMIDTLKKLPFFKALSNVTYMAGSGYYPLKYVQIGDLYSLISNNSYEGLRTGLAIRTSRSVSKRFEIGGTLAYGFKDQCFKHSETIRYNITPKKRGMMTAYYSSDVEQIGAAPNATAVGSTFATLFRTGPMDKLTYVRRTGVNLEKDFRKDIVLFGGFEWKEFTSIGKANYVKWSNLLNTLDTLPNVISSEFIARIRWTKDEEFLGGPFERVTLRSKFPVFAIQGIFGVKGLFGANYNYQKIEFQMQHKRPIGYLGSIRYGLNAGYVFGSAAYPFLKVHEGNQSYWFSLYGFNRLNFYEFISDKYIGGFIENHWQGLLFDRLPLIKKLKLRLVTSGRIVYGSLSDRNKKEMLLPTNTRSFGNTPYAEATLGIENILQVFRVDVVWRITHLDPGVHPLGLRIRWSFAL